MDATLTHLCGSFAEGEVGDTSIVADEAAKLTAGSEQREHAGVTKGLAEADIEMLQVLGAERFGDVDEGGVGEAVELFEVKIGK